MNDKRPQKGGWAPGNYAKVCFNCCKKFNGDKRAIICANCAYMVFWKLVLKDFFNPIVLIWRKLFRNL